MRVGQAGVPLQLTSFVGRDAEVRELTQLVLDCRLVTLMGSGGCGKTRLALEIASRVAGGRSDGVAFIDLSSVVTSSDVSAAVVGSLGLREPMGRDPTLTLVTQLGGSDCLLLLDNCEHLVDACADLVERVLQSCPGVGVLVTSREALGVPGETVWSVGGLALPGGSDAAALGSDAVRLFVDRARGVRLDFELDASTAPSVVEICRRLDGNPLALELAAARVRMMSVERIAAALSDRFRLLVGAGRGSARHETLRASMDWSYALLADDERAMLRRLAVFASGFDLEAAEAVCALDPIESAAVLGLLTALVDKSLVTPEDRDRFRLLETVRVYATEMLESTTEADVVRSRHLECFVERCQAAESSLWTSEMPAALRRLAPDLPNVRAALDWSLASEAAERGADLLSALGNFFYVLGLRHEAWGRCERLLAAGLEPTRQAEMLFWAANFAWYSNPATTLRHGSTLAALGREHRNQGWVARGLTQIGAVQMHMDPSAALETLRDALERARDAGLETAAVDALTFMGFAHLALGQFGDAGRFGREAMSAAMAIDGLWAATFARVVTAAAAAEQGALREARQEAAEVLALGIELDDPLFCELGELFTARVQMCRGDPHAAHSLERARAVAERTGDQTNLIGIRSREGHLLLWEGRLAEARVVLADVVAKVAQHAPMQADVDRALLAEIEVWCGDAEAAERHLGSLVGADRAQPPSVLRARARLARWFEDFISARRFALQGLSAALRSDARLVMIDLLELVAMIAADDHDQTLAARLLGTADVQHAATGYVAPLPHRQEVATTKERLADDLGDDALNRLLAEGSALSADEAVEYATRGRGRRARPATGWASLTPTEQRVVALVVSGQSNAEIADGLFVSVATVKSHLTHIFAKLGVADRRELRAAVADRVARP